MLHLTICGLVALCVCDPRAVRAADHTDATKELPPGLLAEQSDFDLAALAAGWRRNLTDRVLPYWYDTAIDWERGGYTLADDAASDVPANPNVTWTRKMVVTQARMVWR